MARRQSDSGSTTGHEADVWAMSDSLRERRWAVLKARVPQPVLGRTVDQAIAAIERDNPAAQEVLPNDYVPHALDKHRLLHLIDPIGNTRVGDAGARSCDVLGRVYDCLLSQFASAKGKWGRALYTSRCFDKFLVEVLELNWGWAFGRCYPAARTRELAALQFSIHELIPANTNARNDRLGAAP